VGPGRTLDVQISGRTGTNGLSSVPADATAVAVNVTVDGPTSPGYLTVWPSGQPKPLASSLNFVPGQTVPNLVIAKLGSGGKISIFNNAGNTHVIADVVGYFSGHGATFTPLNPDRLLDTRSGFGGPPVGQGQGIDVQIAGRTGANGLSSVPGNATAVALNVTVTNPDAPSFATVWPTGASRPFASNLNFTPGQSVPNMVIAKLGAGGKISIYNNTGNTDVVADVVGYFTG
jgi:hypothetical protein